MNQNNSRDQNFAPSFRNDSHISSRNEHRTATPHFKMTVICYFEGIVIFFRKDRPLSFRYGNWRSHINRSLIHHFKGTAYIQSLWDSFFSRLFCVWYGLCLYRLSVLHTKQPERRRRKNASLWLTYGASFRRDNHFLSSRNYRLSSLMGYPSFLCMGYRMGHRTGYPICHFGKKIINSFQ